jgi:hypothetical protein
MRTIIIKRRGPFIEEISRERGERERERERERGGGERLRREITLYDGLLN